MSVIFEDAAGSLSAPPVPLSLWLLHCSWPRAARSDAARVLARGGGNRGTSSRRHRREEREEIFDQSREAAAIPTAAHTPG